MQDQAKRMKYIRMKTFKKGTEEREDLLVAYQNWAVKVAQEKEKRLQEVIEERRRKLKEEYFKEQAKKQRKKGFLGIKNLVKKHITELKTTNTALVNSESEPQIQQPQEGQQESGGDQKEINVQRRQAFISPQNQESQDQPNKEGDKTQGDSDAMVLEEDIESPVDGFIDRRMKKKGQKNETDELRLGVMPHQNGKSCMIHAIVYYIALFFL